MSEEQSQQQPTTPASGSGTVHIVKIDTPEMIKQGSILPTFVAPPPPPKDSK